MRLGLPEQGWIMTDAAQIAAGLTEGEKRRLIDGRRDWREHEWQDHCGDWDCDRCEGALIPDTNPSQIRKEDVPLRDYLMENG